MQQFLKQADRKVFVNFDNVKYFVLNVKTNISSQYKFCDKLKIKRDSISNPCKIDSYFNFEYKVKEI